MPRRPLRLHRRRVGGHARRLDRLVAVQDVRARLGQGDGAHRPQDVYPAAAGGAYAGRGRDGADGRQGYLGMGHNIAVLVYAIDPSGIGFYMWALHAGRTRTR